MIYFALTQNSRVYEKAVALLKEKFGPEGDLKIDFSHPKPTLAGAYAGVYDFNISHSGDMAAIAAGDEEVGCDIEIFKGRPRAAVLARFTPRERAGICGEDGFLKNWTAKEAYIKRNGLSLATHLRRLEYFDGRIWLDGRALPCTLTHIPFEGGIACVCGQGRVQICDIQHII